MNITDEESPAHINPVPESEGIPQSYAILNDVDSTKKSKTPCEGKCHYLTRSFSDSLVRGKSDPVRINMEMLDNNKITTLNSRPKALSISSRPPLATPNQTPLQQRPCTLPLGSPSDKSSVSPTPVTSVKEHFNCRLYRLFRKAQEKQIEDSTEASYVNDGLGP